MEVHWIACSDSMPLFNTLVLIYIESERWWGDSITTAKLRETPWGNVWNFENTQLPEKAVTFWAEVKGPHDESS